MINFFFFFQAEDGIRDRTVTGVQTLLFRSRRSRGIHLARGRCGDRVRAARRGGGVGARVGGGNGRARSEERRVGEEWRWGGGGCRGEKNGERWVATRYM